MVCTNCGNHMPETDTICLVCGKKNVPAADVSGIFNAASTEVLPDSNAQERKSVLQSMPLAKKILLIVPIVALFAIAATVLFATQNPSSKDPDSQIVESQGDTGEAEDTDTEQAAATTETTPAAVLTMTLNDEEKDIYNSYILNTLIPEYGLATTARIEVDFEWTGQSTVEIPPIPQENKGILSCITEDLDNDGSLELLMTNATTTNDQEDHQYQGVGIHIYALQDDEVYEIPFQRPENSYPDELTYNLSEYYQVSIVHNGESRYVFLSNYRFLPGEGLWVDDFEYSFYQVTDEGAKCVDSIRVNNGIISDLLVKTGSDSPVFKEVYSVWTDSSAENLFSKIKEYFDKYGVDSSWLKPYYDDLFFYEDKISSNSIENLITPISEMTQNVISVTTVFGTEQLFSESGTQKYTITDYTNIRTELGMDSAVGKQD